MNTWKNPQEVKVPFVDGTIEILYGDRSNDGYSIAKGQDRLDPQGVYSIGIRWNTSRNDTPNGYPVSNGNPAWFKIPSDMAVCLLNGLLSDDKKELNSEKKTKIEEAIKEIEK